MNAILEWIKGLCPEIESWQSEMIADRIDADAERIKALEADAERYRWLRERYSALTRMEIARGLGLDLSKVYVNTAEKFDAAIDAARSKT